MEKQHSNYLDHLQIILPEGQVVVDDEKLFNLLKEEYFYHHRAIDEYDNKAITIKAWSISFSLAIFATGLIQESSHLFLLVAVSAVLFWSLETYWKLFQQAFYRRAMDIERFLNGKSVEKFRLVNIMGSFNFHFQGLLKKSWWRTMFLPQVYLPHLAIAVLALLLWIASID